jgi:hypothetical protein
MALSAPANGLKLMALIVVVFALVALYGQWQHSRRARVETATITSLPQVSPTPLPNKP